MELIEVDHKPTGEELDALRDCRGEYRQSRHVLVFPDEASLNAYHLRVTDME